MNSYVHRLCAVYTLVLSAPLCAIACSGDASTTTNLVESDAGTLSSEASVEGPPDSGTVHDSALPPDGDTDIDADGGLPSVQSLVLWLDPARGIVTDARGVSEWQDQSVAKTPTTLRIGTAGPTVINSPSHPTILDMSSGSSVGIALKSPIGMRAFSTLFVARLFNNDSATLFATDEAGAGLQFSMSGTNRLYVTAPHKGGPTFTFNPSIPDPTGALHVFALRRKGSAYEVRVDGTGQSMSDGGGAYDMQQPLRFFAHSPTHILQAGDVLLYDADLSDAKLQAAEAFLKSKYKI